MGHIDTRKICHSHLHIHFEFSDMWDQEYLPEFIMKATALGLGFEQDSEGRTPSHYAAMHGQTVLLKHFIASNARINVSDYNRTSELWYAVSGNNLKCVQALLEAGAKVDHGTRPEGKSALLLAVQHQNTEMVDILLKNSNGDTSGHAQAVMYCCAKSLYNILKVNLQTFVLFPGLVLSAIYLSF